MRFYKYLNFTRLIKRITIENVGCYAVKITVNGVVAKASYQVKIGDVIEIVLGTRSTKVQVTALNEHANKESAAQNFVVIEE